MKIYTLWEEGNGGDMPWLVDAVDDVTVGDNGWPESYLDERDTKPSGGRVRRELAIEIPDSVVERLFQIPTVKVAVKLE